MLHSFGLLRDGGAGRGREAAGGAEAFDAMLSDGLVDLRDEPAAEAV
jgi:hypothetical protein